MRPAIALTATLCLAPAALPPAYAEAPVQAPAPTPAPAPAPKPAAQDLQKMMASTFGVMVPIMGKMTEVMIDAQLKMAVLPETAERIATFKKNLFDALLKRGFTPDQAMQIVLATSIPAAAPSMK